jgi:hypothetical protein
MESAGHPAVKMKQQSISIVFFHMNDKRFLTRSKKGKRSLNLGKHGQQRMDSGAREGHIEEDQEKGIDAGLKVEIAKVYLV